MGVGPILVFYFRFVKVWTSGKLPQSGANRFHNALFALVFSGAASLNGALLVKSPYTVAHTKRDFFEELDVAIEIDALLADRLKKSVVNDELPFPCATGADSFSFVVEPRIFSA